MPRYRWLFSLEAKVANAIDSLHPSCEIQMKRPMNSYARLQHQGQRLLQFGMVLFLFSSFDGFAIPVLASQRIGLSAHTLSALQGVMILAIGLLWPKLKLNSRAAQIAFWT